MAHDEHFLLRLERLDDAGVSFALSLYRNVPLVKAIVREAAPPGATRVAIAIGDGPQPPHVLVEPSGRFVTCLAAGMPHDLPIISRGAVDRAARHSEELRRALAVNEELKKTPDFADEVLRVHRGPWLSREEAGHVFAWAPVLDDAYRRDVIDSLRAHLLAWGALSHRESFKERHQPELRRLWRYGWATGHMVGPAASSFRRLYEMKPEKFRGRASYPLVACLPQRQIPTALRGAWALAHMGEPILDDLSAVFLQREEHPGRSFTSGVGLAALALRWPRLRARARAALEQPLAPASDPRHDELLARLRHNVAHPEEALARHLERATAWLAGQGVETEGLGAPTILAASFYEPRVLDEEFYAALVDGVPFVAASSWEELYLPAEVLERLPQPALAESARVYGEGRAAIARLERAEKQPAGPPEPPRNAPCPCGSGKKRKRCCGAER